MVPTLTYIVVIVRILSEHDRLEQDFKVSVQSNNIVIAKCDKCRILILAVFITDFTELVIH